MMKRSPEVPGSSPPLFFTGYFYGICALGGLLAAAIIFLLLSYGEHLDEQEYARESSLQSLAFAKASMEKTWSRADFWVDQIAWQLGAAEREAIPMLLAQYQRLWPAAGFSLFDRSAKLMTGLASSQIQGESIVDLPNLNAMVLRALDGERTRDYTFFRGFLSLGVAVPVQGKQVRAMVISIPLDSEYLRSVKSIAGADLAVAPLDMATNSVLGDMSNAGNTFGQREEQPESLWTKLGSLLKNAPLSAGTPLLLREADFYAGLEPLVNAQGAPMGLLLAAPRHTPAKGFPLWHLYAAIGGGLVSALLLGLFLRYREKRMAAAVAADMLGLVRDLEAEPQNVWPASLSGAFRKVAESFQEYRILLENASVAKTEANTKAEKVDEACRQRDAAEYQRLFDSLPVGAFQAARNGRFLKVNPAFAFLLGYDSPMNMLADCGSFNNICLYGEGIRNPLGIIMEQGAGRHVLSLRRRDGKVRHFAVICRALTMETGDDADIIEGFLLDRDLEEKLAAAERESLYARQERESLALLLAATCRQTQSYFRPPPDQPQQAPQEIQGQTGAVEGEPRPAGQQGQAAWPEFKKLSGSAPEIESGAGQGPSPEEEADDAEERRERRKSVLSMKAVLSDIYQIAMTEVEGTAPLDVPMEFRHFMKRVCRQALPTLFSRGISLRCEIAEEILMRMSGPAPLLRHAILRALLAVTAPAQGGWACLSVMRDPNAPSRAGVSRLLFSVSWSPYSRGGMEGGPADDRAMLAADQGYTVFVAEVNAELPASSTQPIAGALDISAEQSVIRYLAHKMRGELLEGVFNSELRSIQLIVPLEHMSEYGEDTRAQGSQQEVVDLTVEKDDVPGGDAFDENSRESATGDDEASKVWVAAANAPTRTAVLGDSEAVELLDAALLARENAENATAEEAGLTEEPQPTSLNLLVMDSDAAVEKLDAGESFASEDELDGGERLDTPSLNILLVDASLNNRLLFSLFLRDTKHSITEAHDGQEGVEAFQRGKFDAIFMDMEMPLMDGYQATRIIRALEADKGLPPTPIVGMTTYALPELRRECMLSGCTEFLSRPFSKNSLLTLLKALAGLKVEKEIQ